MAERPLEYVDDMLDLMEELRLHLKDKAHFRETLKLLNKNYQRGQFGYFRYVTLKKRLLKDKTRKEWQEYYDAYIYGLLKRIDFFNSKIFYDVYSDRTTLKLKIPKRIVTRPKKRPVVMPKPIVKQVKPIIAEPEPEVPKPSKEEKELEKEEHITPEKVEEPPAEETPEKPAIEAAEGGTEGMLEAEVVAEKPEEPVDAEALEEKPPEDAEDLSGVDAEPLERIEAETTTDIPMEGPEPSEEMKDEIGRRTLGRVLFGGEEKKKLAKREDQVLPWLTQEKPKTFSRWLGGLFKPKKSLLEELQGGDDEGLELKHMFTMKFFKNLVSRKGGDEFISAKTQISPSILALKRYKSSEIEPLGEGETLDTSLLLQEAQRLKRIIKKRTKFSVYEHSTIGTVANVMVKRISLFLIETFPDFFKQIYDNLRLADIKILSNTYVNIMLLGIVSVSTVMYFLAVIIFFIQNTPLVLIFLRSFVVAGLFGAMTFLGFYLYPNMRMKQRRRSINTNLPFAINHMSAVASSGVPPEAMFRLIAESKEYMQISVEIEKISEYIEVFGYDILTAMKSVSATTPSEQMKSFFEGFISAIETGGDLKHYLEQKAEEAMLQYKLERQKYQESISTYSDIYTGLLIAAPLFFVVALSLISLLGGQIGGMEVESLIALGTYMVIPLLNVAFIVFLELTQPEV